MASSLLVLELFHDFLNRHSGCIAFDLDNGVFLLGLRLRKRESDNVSIWMYEGYSRAVSIIKRRLQYLRLCLNIGCLRVAIVFEGRCHFGGVLLQYEAGGYVDWIGVYSLYRLHLERKNKA